jgi:outer membrane protein
VNEVAKANGYTHVLNSDQVLLYAEEESDITDLVFNQLGIKPPAEGDKVEEKPTATPATGGSTPPKKAPVKK